MHEVPRLPTKVVHGLQQFTRHQPKAPYTNTVRTPTDKSVWGMTAVKANLVGKTHAILGAQRVVELFFLILEGPASRQGT